MHSLTCFIIITIFSYGFCETNNLEKPNIILILADDIGWNDFGFHGSNQIPTPNIDALGYNGVFLNRFYTQQTCTPSRSALLTGNYPIRSGMQGIPLRAGENRSLPLDQITLPQQLKKLGYKTNLVGKWHLGYPYKESAPLGKGFDYHFGYWNGYVGYFSYYLTQLYPDSTSYTGYDLHENFVPQWSLKGQYATELFTEKSLEIIEKHNTEEPLFLMLCHLAAHTGDNGTELGVPDYNITQTKYSYIKNDNRKRYADVVNIMDESIGRIMEKLSDKNMLENSLIIFLSDNGAPTRGLYGNDGSNWPLRGLKFSLYEGAVRGSAILFSPFLEKSNYINNNLMHITDLYPTIYSAAGGNVHNLGKIDGINQWPTISLNETTTRKELLVNIDELNHYSGYLGYNGRYKLLNGSFQNGFFDNYFGEDGRGPENPEYNINDILNSKTNQAIQKLRNKLALNETFIKEIRSSLNIEKFNETITNRTIIDCNNWCLFDIFEDPCETTNIITEKPTIALELKTKLMELYGEIVPQKSFIKDSNANPVLYNNTWFTWLESNKL